MHRFRRFHFITILTLSLLVLSGCLPAAGDPGTTGALPVVTDPGSTDTAPPVGEPDEPAGPAGSADAGPEADDTPAVPIKAKLAIVIDDLGMGQPGSDELLAFPRPLTFAILPGTPLAKSVAATARDNGHAVLLHLPMEPLNVEANNPGADAIFLAMTDDEIRRQTAAHLDSLPPVDGVNNHMGSAATADARVMAAVLEVVNERGLFFLDSMTTAASVVADEAERIGMPYAVNKLFIDLERTVPAVKEMTAEAIRRAEAQGTFIVIAHPHPSVADALYEMIPAFDAAGIALVPITDLVQQPAN